MRNFCFSLMALGLLCQFNAGYGAVPERCRAVVVEASAGCEHCAKGRLDHQISDFRDMIVRVSYSQPAPVLIGAISEPNQNRFLDRIAMDSSEGEGDLRTPTVDMEGKSDCQSISGYGFAMTESSVINLKRLSQNQYNQALEELFSPKKANMSYVVLPISSTDFNEESLGDFSVCDCKGQRSGPDRTCFDPGRIRQKIEVLKDAQKLNPNLKVMLKPWTTPPYMKKKERGKSPGYLGGNFDGKWAESLGRCLAHAAKYVTAQGLRVQSIAAQNEPGLSLPYPSVYMEDDDHAKVLDALTIELKKFKLNPQIVIRSDNFVGAPNAKATLLAMKQAPSNPIFSAHCYSNDPETSRELLPPGSDRFCSSRLPTKMEYLMGECTASGKPNMSGDFGWWMSNRVMQDTDMGATGIIAWNGVLDHQFGPRNKGCTGCRGLITADFSTTKPELHVNPELKAISHLSRFVQPGAKRILNDSSEDAVANLVFRNPNGSTVVLLHNKGLKTSKVDLYTPDCKRVPVILPPNATMTLKTGG